MITPGGRVGDASPLGTHGPRRLDDYVRAVAHALMRKRGFTKSHAIATAKNALKRWRRGGGHVRPQVRAGAAAHLGIQEGLDKRHGGGLNLSAAQAEVLDVALAEADRRAFLDFATVAGLDGDEIELAMAHAPYRYRHGWLPILGTSRLPVEADAHLTGPSARKARKDMARTVEANRSLHDALGRLHETAPTRRSTKKRTRTERVAAKRRKRTVDAARREQSRRLVASRKIAAAQQEQARRIVARTGLRTGPGEARRVPGTYTPPEIPFKISHMPLGALASGGFSEAQQAVLDLAVVEALGRDIELAPHWRHGWIPLNEEALAIKLKKAEASGGGPKAPPARSGFGRFRTSAQNDLSHIKSPEHLDKIYRAHVALTDSKLVKLGPTHSTHVTHADTIVHPDGSTSYDWGKDPERAKMHAKIVDNVYRRMAKSAKSDKQALFLGGLPGAGKSTALKKLPHVNEKDYVTVNPDIFKEELAKHGLVPNVPGMSPMEASGLVHEESSHLANLLAEKARRNNKNIAYDITMNSDGSVYKRLKPLDESGYTSKAVFVDIPFEMSQQRVEDRHRNGWLRYIKDKSGTDLGQRLVPSNHVKSGQSTTGSSSANFDAFQHVKHRFSAYQVFDNSGSEPRLIDQSGSF